MGKIWNKRVLCVLMQWDYCDRRLGISGDKVCFFNNISKLVLQAEPFWYDAYVNDLPQLRKLLLQKADAFQPDLIFYPTYTNQLDVETLIRLKEKWPTCAWFGDDTWRFNNYSSKLAPHFTYVLTTDHFSLERYHDIAVNPILTQWGAQPYGNISMHPVDFKTYRYDVSFVGAYNSVRAWYIKMLAEKGITVKCFGNGWTEGKISYAEMYRVFRESRINLNLSNSISRDVRFIFGNPMNLVRYLRSAKTVEQIKARNFEIPLGGGFQLTNYVAGLERYLQIGKEVAVFSSIEECIQQIKYYLSNEKERYSIAAMGHYRTVRDHTYISRFEEIFKKIWG